MAKFCGACGQKLSDSSAFCIQCGTPTQSAVPAPAPVQPPTPPPAPSLSDAPTQGYAQVNVPPPVQPAYTPVSTQPPVQYAPVNTPPPAQYAPVSTPSPVQYAPVNPPGGPPPQFPPAPVAGGSSGSGLKIVLAILAVLFVGGLLVMGGLFYVGHRVVNKIKTAAAENGLSTPSDTTTPAVAPFHGDACALLSKDDVGASIGVLIVATRTTGDGCEYLAHGTASDMTARHLSATMAAKGATSEQQDTAHQLAGDLLGAAQRNDPKD
jgi:hypothetical protein